MGRASSAKALQAPDRARLDNFGLLLAEAKRRRARSEQSRRGWYDEHGVRQGGLIAFVRYFWPILEPATKFVDGWALWAVVEHLEAVTAGEITRILINVPPGFAKSIIVDCFWPAWEWGPMGLPHLRYVAFSYSGSLTERDNGRFRDLITSAAYRDLYGNALRLRNKTIIRVANDRSGWKLASSVGGVGTGERGDRVLLDDPHNVKESESEVVRTETVRWFRESLSSRFNDIQSGVLVIIMQRVHENDVSGAILELGLDYVHLLIPMEYDWGRQTDDDGGPLETSIGWTDPRYDERGADYCDGALAWPERFPAEALARTKAEVGPYAWASQFQQAPAPRGGGIFQRDWWQVWDDPDGAFPALEYTIGSVDGAFTEDEENHPSAMTVWGVFVHERRRRIILIDAWRKFLKFSAPPIERIDKTTVIDGQVWHADVVTPGMAVSLAKHRNDLYRRRASKEWGLVEWVADTCRNRRVDQLLIEGKASGISAATELRNRYPNERWSIQVMQVKGDKVARALAAQPTFSQRLVYAPIREWAEMTIDEMATFPKARYDDLTDSATQAINYLRSMGMALTDEEVSEAEIANVRLKPKLKSLYPC